MNIFGLGIDKLVVIAFIAALLLSPTQLLVYAKKIGFYAGRLRAMSDLVKKQLTVDSTKTPVGDFSVTDDEAT